VGNFNNDNGQLDGSLSLVFAEDFKAEEKVI